MRKAVKVEFVEYCNECPFAQYRGSQVARICTQLSQEDTLPFVYVYIESRKDVREDCPLEIV